jgi:phosphate transport system substrate-binding protein
MLFVTTNFCACGSAKSVTISGSSSVMPLMQKLSAEYEKQHDVRIIINMSSSGAGITDTQNGLNDFGMSSRTISESEVGVEGKVLCLDAIALIVGNNSSAENVTSEQVRTLFCEGTPIESQGITAGIGRDGASGTRVTFDSVFNIDSYHKSIATLAETGNVIEAVAPTTSTLAYISFGSLTDRVKAVKLNDIDCTEANIKDGTYELYRPFIVVLSKERSLNETAQGFYDYIMSDEAQEIIVREKYISAKNDG